MLDIASVREIGMNPPMYKEEGGGVIPNQQSFISKEQSDGAILNLMIAVKELQKEKVTVLH
jgi:hypothetical protein